MESQIADAINLSNVVYNNDDMLSACNVDYGNNYFRMYTAYQNDILPDMYIYKCLLPDDVQCQNLYLLRPCAL